MIGSYLVTSILVNFNKVITIDTSVKPSITKVEVDGPDRKWCDYCQVDQPPRAYHCSTCHACIEKRDHHCLFTACCVGKHNHRYFIAGILAICVGAVYGVVYEMPMVLDAAGGWSLWLPLQLMCPHLVAPFGVLGVWGFVACVHNMLGVSVLVNAGYILYAQLSALRRGQTQYEWKHGTAPYDRGWRENVRLTLGERPVLALLWPLLESPLPPTHGHAEADRGNGVGVVLGDTQRSVSPGSTGELRQRMGTSDQEM